MSDIGVLVCDMQEELIHPPDDFSARDEAETTRLIAHSGKVLRAAVGLNLPIAYVEFKGYGPTIPELLVFCQDYRRFAKIAKDSDDALESADLMSFLNSYKVARLIALGINASFCLKDTVDSARKKGFEVVTSFDLMSDPLVSRPFTFEVSQQFYRRTATVMPDYRVVIDYMRMPVAANITRVAEKTI